ncbi:HAD family hydrolase [Streptococcus chenjunshii]|uniref:HAD family hydrolase n=1 Tax=Streptococcus chenjunshii TaxID=2173853 RepID=A0A372KLR0_9STRE|nr:HAD family hydrolase [Streptococcus chenjunshii]AXQ78350.1 HAD family hydrolase [Streptococcus chenjunshii]RFU50313.1 HAD family hydrolase [Streptococcus chenjunshii]RFU52518.1 HAD family hydrolase [Streptococcus chenjunshii]
MARAFKLVVTDMDGTFLNHQGEFSMERLKAVIENFKRKGILFAAASGRSLSNLETTFAEVKNDMAFIAENGTLVSYESAVIFEAAIPKAHYLQALADLRQVPHFNPKNVILSGRQGAYILAQADSAFFDYMSYYYGNLRRVADFEEINDSILKIDTKFPPEHTDISEQLINQQLQDLTAVTTGFGAIDIITKNINKGTAVQKLCERLGVSSQDVLAFGDNLNDYEMLAYAGCAVAPKNARKEIKRLADQIIADHKEFSVMSYIEKL